MTMQPEVDDNEAAARAHAGQVESHVAAHAGQIILTPKDPFEAIIIKMVETNRKKRKDYAGDNPNPFQNFYDSSNQVGLSPGASCEVLIGTKQARLKTLLPRYWDGFDGPQNEPIEDTLLDRAVYSVIALCIWAQGGYDGPSKS